MPIETKGISSGYGVAAPGRAGRSANAAGAFSVPTTATATATAPRAAAALDGPAAIGGLLGLWESEADSVRDRHARRHGRAMLDALAGLQHALLGGAPADRAALAALADTPVPVDDPRLTAVLADIRLRARIELARPPRAHG